MRPGAHSRALLGALEAVYVVDTRRRAPQLEALFPGVELVYPRTDGWSGCIRMITLGEWSRRIRDRTVVVWAPEPPAEPTIRQMRATGRAAVQAGAIRAFGQIHLGEPRRILIGGE